ncbi:MAG: trypsin-like peptidase domain-containing protein [Acidimicrobiales bacterium]|jgi:serine protease Do
MSTSLVEFSDAVAEVIAAATPSVVGVGRAGSGVVVADGLVLTNAHNLRGEVEVSFEDGRVAVASVAGADVDGDLAVLSVDTAGAPALSWAEDAPALGQVVIGLSRPGGRSLRAGVGFISGLGLNFRGPGGSTVTGALEHGAPLVPGSSGGPLVGSDGRLVGINTHREGEGFYLALPAGAELKERVDALARGEVPRRVRLGVALAPPKMARRLRHAVGLPERDGLLVHAVEPEGAAARAGVRRGDLIVSVGGQPVGSAGQLATLLSSIDDAGTADLVVVRGVDELSIAVHFGQAGPSEQGTA